MRIDVEYALWTLRKYLFLMQKNSDDEMCLALKQFLFSKSKCSIQKHR